MHRLAFSWLLVVSMPFTIFAGNSNSLLDVSPDGKNLLVANTDSGTVSLVDLATRQLLAEIPVGEKPEGVTWIGTGPLAAATVNWTDEVVFIDTAQRQVIDRIKVANEPYGIVSSKDGRKLWITHDYWGTVSEIDTSTRKVIREIPWCDSSAVSPFPRRETTLCHGLLQC
jgi:YVTN family beta-propeller protein